MAGAAYLKFKNVLHRRTTQSFMVTRFSEIAICTLVKSPECSILGQASLSHEGYVRLMSGSVNKVNRKG
jgi:hypothetical protein